MITDGYEGDYTTWKESLATGVPVATLEEVDWIANDPRGAFKTLAERAGIEEQLRRKNFLNAVSRSAIGRFGCSIDPNPRKRSG